MTLIPQGHYNQILMTGGGQIAGSCCCGTGETSVCSTNNCAGTNNPSIILTVFNQGATEVVKWCGKTWNLPADNGLQQCVCPTTYINTLGGTGVRTEQSWSNSSTGGLQMYRYKDYSLNSPFTPRSDFRQAMSINPGIGGNFLYGGNSYYHYTIFATPPGSYVYSKVLDFSTASPVPYPVYAYNFGGTTGTRKIPDSYFMTWTANSVTFQHQKGANWP